MKNSNLQKLKFERKYISATIEVFLFLVLGFFIVMFPFAGSLFPNAKTYLYFTLFSVFLGAFCIFGMTFYIFDAIAYDWFLQDGVLEKRRKHTSEVVFAIDISDVIILRCRREVPLIGRYWYVTLASKKIPETPEVLFRILNLKITSRPGLSKRYVLGFIKANDKDQLLSEVQAASKQTRQT